ncbi:MAG: multiheme c-type cytochrome [Pirellulaceae bacterium]
MCDQPLRYGWSIGTLAIAAALLGCGGSGGVPPAEPTPEVVAKNGPAQPSATDAPAETPAPGEAPAAVAIELPSPFADWGKPAVVLFLTGEQRGYIEPCGCTGLENQKGGLARRHTLLRQLSDDKGWAVVPLDVGSQVRRYGGQAEIKFQRTADALRTMGYQSVVLGSDDLRLPAGSLYGATHVDDKPSIFGSANVALFDPTAQPPFQVIEAGGKKIGTIGVLGDSFEQKLQGDELVHVPAAEGLKKAAAELKAQACDYHVLLAHSTVEEAKELARQTPLLDLVVCSGGGLPSSEFEAIEGSQAKLLKIGHKAMHVGVVGLFGTEADTVRYQSVALDAKLADSPEMLRLLADYQKQLQATPWEELGLKPQPHASGNRYVGSATCGDCHTKAMAIWSETPHAHATDSLVHPPNNRGDIPRHYDPECLSCHVTGWEPQKFYPFESGYLSLEKTPQLQHNGCENCHGPGSAHVAAENGEGSPTDETIAKLRDSMKLPIAGGVAENKCRECHDEDNSPDFSHRGFAAYWKEVEHIGKD